MRRRRSHPLAWRAAHYLPRDRWEALAEMMALTLLGCVLLAEALVVAVGLGAR